MVNFSNQSPFLQDDGSHDPEALCSTHKRSLELLKTIMQIDAVLAAVIVVSLVGKDRHEVAKEGENSQVILQVVTCSVFLAAVAHSVVLMVCTGWRYTLTWYDPLFPTVFSAVGAVLLYMTLANAILVRLRPTGEDLDTAGYWSTVLFALNLPLALAGPLVTVQMVLHRFSSINVRSENANTGRELI
eukprot:g5843.t1